MRFNASYTKEKFLSFSYDAQIKALGKLIGQMQDEIANPPVLHEILDQFRKLYPLAKNPLPAKMARLVQSLSEDPFRLLRAISIYYSDLPVKDSQIYLRTGDGTITPDSDALVRSKQIVLVLDNLRSVFNVGSVFRLCECLAVSELILCGITPTPKHPNMLKTALGTCERVPWRHVEQTETAITGLQERGFVVYALETANPSVSAFESDYSLPLALVVGNESLGISPQILTICDRIIHLPVLGWKNSLNVGVATSVALYQILFGTHGGVYDKSRILL